MRVGGFFVLLRAGFATLVRSLSSTTAWLADVIGLAADLADPAMPETIRRPREWMPRLWDRTGGRTANEARD